MSKKREDKNLSGNSLNSEKIPSQKNLISLKHKTKNKFQKKRVIPMTTLSLCQRLKQSETKSRNKTYKSNNLYYNYH